MIEEHQELLGQIEAAEKSALSLYEKGEQIEGVIRSLRSEAQVIRERLQIYRSQAQKPPPKKAETLKR